MEGEHFRGFEGEELAQNHPKSTFTTRGSKSPKIEFFHQNGSKSTKIDIFDQNGSKSTFSTEMAKNRPFPPKSYRYVE